MFRRCTYAFHHMADYVLHLLDIAITIRSYKARCSMMCITNESYTALYSIYMYFSLRSLHCSLLPSLHSYALGCFFCLTYHSYSQILCMSGMPKLYCLLTMLLCLVCIHMFFPLLQVPYSMYWQ